MFLALKLLYGEWSGCPKNTKASNFYQKHTVNSSFQVVWKQALMLVSGSPNSASRNLLDKPCHLLRFGPQILSPNILHNAAVLIQWQEGDDCLGEGSKKYFLLTSTQATWRSISLLGSILAILLAHVWEEVGGCQVGIGFQQALLLLLGSTPPFPTWTNTTATLPYGFWKSLGCERHVQPFVPATLQCATVAYVWWHQENYRRHSVWLWYLYFMIFVQTVISNHPAVFQMRRMLRFAGMLPPHLCSHSQL